MTYLPRAGFQPPFPAWGFKRDDMNIFVLILVLFLTIGYGIQIWDEYIKAKRSDK